MAVSVPLTGMRKPLIHHLRQCFGPLVLICLLAGCGRKDGSPKDLVSRLASEKEGQARRLFQDESTRFPPEARLFFRAAKAGRWEEATNLYAEIQQKYILAMGPPTNAWDACMARTYTALSRYDLTRTNYWALSYGPQWRPIEDVHWAIYQFQRWDPELIQFYATNIISSIPAGSVFISGSPFGFFVIPALNSHSGRDGDPFVTLTPNKLVDDSYVEYARRMYGTKLKMLAQDDLADAYSDYVSDATERARLGLLKPGEIFTNNGAGGVSLNGEVAMTQLNALLLKRLFTLNPDRDFYYDEGWTLDWTTPYLIPHGLILKINHTPLDSLDPAVVDRDRQYWNAIVRSMTGLELDDTTPLTQISSFAETVYLRKDLSYFHGNSRFVTNEIAQTAFAKLRVSIARVYAWRAANSSTESEKPQMAREADFAFRQTFALCPRVAELDQYGIFLFSQGRTNDLQTLADAVKKFDPGGSTAIYLNNLANYHP